MTSPLTPGGDRLAPPVAAPPLALPLRQGQAVSPAPRPAPADLAPPEVSLAGEVSVDAELRVTFLVPMVGLSLGPAQPPLPATITPATPGAWRWIDASTAAFVPAAGRFAAATRYQVKIPAGVRSVAGATLARAASFQFETPAPSLVDVSPMMLRANTPLVLRFDQAVDLDAAWRKVQVNYGGSPLAIRRMTVAEARPLWGSPSGTPAQWRDALEEGALGDHSLIIGPKDAWPTGDWLQIVVQPGLRSLEGPITSAKDALRVAQVAPRLRLLGGACGQRQKTPAGRLVPCAPGESLELQVTTPLAQPPSAVIIDKTPIRTAASSSAGTIRVPLPNTAGKVVVRLAEPLTDIYGQTLADGELTVDISPAHATPTVAGPNGLIVLDPRFAVPQWVLHAQDAPTVKVELWSVSPADYFAYEALSARNNTAGPPGRKVYERSFSMGTSAAGELRVDLRAALGPAGTGHVIARAIPIGKASGEPLLAWIQVTKLAAMTQYDKQRATVWVQHLDGGGAASPIAARTSLLVKQGKRLVSTAEVATDKEGRSEHRLLPASERADELIGESADEVLAIARTKDDSTFALAHGAVSPGAEEKEALWYVTDAQRLYRVGDTLRVAGYLRWKATGPDPRLQTGGRFEPISYTFTDARGLMLGGGKGTAFLGGFHFSLPIPMNAALGHATVTISARGQSTEHQVELTESRSPPFLAELLATPDRKAAAATQVFVGEAASLDVSARYFSGGALGGALVRWRSELRPTRFSPPGWGDFDFSPAPAHGVVARRAETSLSNQGRARAQVVIGAAPWQGPSTLALEAEVRDVDRQVVRTPQVQWLVHGSKLYVGLREVSVTEIEAVVVDAAGALVQGAPFSVTVAPEALGVVRGAVGRTCALVSATAPVRCRFEPLHARWVATARAVDSDGNEARAELQGGTSLVEEAPDLWLTSTQKEWYPDEYARVVVHSKRFPATAIITVASAGIVSQQRIALHTEQTPVDIKIPGGDASNAFVIAHRFASVRTSASAPPLLTSETSTLELDVATGLRKLGVAVEATASKGPGQEATFRATVSYGGRPPLGGEVVIFAVDEAVLASSGRGHGDPLAAFLFRADNDVWDESTLRLLWDNAAELEGEPGVFEGKRSDHEVGHGRAAGRGAVPQVRIGAASPERGRVDFRPVALWAPRVPIGPDGQAVVTVRIPDTLTRYRVVALAAWNDAFGKAESTFDVTKPLSARLTAPSWLTVGDTASLPVVVQNLGAERREVDVALRARGLEVVGSAAQRVTLAAGQRGEVRFDVVARELGAAVLQTVARAGDEVDVTQSELVVRAPAVLERTATYLAIEDTPVRLPVIAPKDLDASVGGIEVTLSSSQLSGLAEAFWYLQEYPYECAEQRSARVLSTSILADTFELLAEPGRPKLAELLAKRAADLSTLASEQRSDGSWGLFPEMASDPVVTMQVVRALASDPAVRGGPRGAKGSPATRAFDAGVAYVQALLRKQLGALGASATPAQLRASAELATMALDTLCEVTPRCGGEAAVNAALGKLAAAEHDDLSIDARARLARLTAGRPRHAALRDKLRAQLVAATRETAADAKIVAPAGQESASPFSSEGLSTALVLEALSAAPAHPLAAKLARGLLDRRGAGRWGSTHENVAVLRALRAHLANEQAPRFLGKVIVGEVGFAERSFVGRQTPPAVLRVPWTDLGQAAPLALTLSRAGSGAMLARVAATYAPASRTLSALDAGFVVRRSYAAVNPADVVRRPDGSLRVRLGAQLVVTLEVSAPAERANVALVDELPAGLVALDERRANGERAQVASNRGPWEHINLRATRTEAFLRSLPRGTSFLRYTVRAMTPGTFWAAPAYAEEMYHPETYGRSASERVVIE